MIQKPLPPPPDLYLPPLVHLHALLLPHQPGMRCWMQASKVLTLQLFNMMWKHFRRFKIPTNLFLFFLQLCVTKCFVLLLCIRILLFFCIFLHLRLGLWRLDRFCYSFLHPSHSSSSSSSSSSTFNKSFWLILTQWTQCFDIATIDTAM